MSKADQTRQTIVELSSQVFNTKGYAGTSFSDIIHATGLSKGCIYGHFENKDAIAVAAFDFNHQAVTELMKSKIVATDYSIDRLLVYPAIYRDYDKHPCLRAGCPILNTAIEADDTHPQLRERAAHALEFWKRSLENQINRGISRCEIRSDTDAAEFATIMISIIEGAFMQSKVKEDLKDLTIAMDFLEKMILALKA